MLNSLKPPQSSQKPTPSVLFEVTANGLSSFHSLGKLKLFQYLFSLSQKHISEGRQQIVIFAFDFIGHHVNLDGLFEKGELETLFGWLSTQPGAFDGVAIDVGANVGNHSLYFSRFYQHVYSFEPNPRTCQVLRLNAELATNITCYEVGLSDTAGNAYLNVYANNIGHAEIARGEAGVGTITKSIRLQTLDEFQEMAGRVRLIKFDVEGHEYQAIQGALQTIQRNQPVIMFEQLAAEIEQGTSPTIELLKSLGYSRFASVEQVTRQLRSSNLLLNSLLQLVNRLPIAKSFLFGTAWRIQLQQTFLPIEYPLIVAIPAWCELASI